MARGSTPEGIRHVAEAAAELGLDSVWATEHVIVGPEAQDAFGCVFEPLAVLGWITGFTERVGLGTSVLILPLCTTRCASRRKPPRCSTCRAADCCSASQPGWHEDEFHQVGVPFKGRGRRGDEATRLMRALCCWDIVRG